MGAPGRGGRKAGAEKQLASLEAVFDAVSELVYVPTPEQRRVKAAFWRRFSESPVAIPGRVDLGSAQVLLNDSRLDRWWKEPGFADWFRNASDFRERLDYLADLALNKYESMITDPTINPAVAGAAARDILKMAGRFEAGGPGGESAAAEAMTPEELRLFVRQHAALLKSILAEDGGGEPTSAVNETLEK